MNPLSIMDVNNSVSNKSMKPAKALESHSQTLAKLHNSFIKINISTFYLLLDPIFNCLLWPLTTIVKVCKCRFHKPSSSPASVGSARCHTCCAWDYTPCQRRQRAFEKVEERLSEELEIVGLLSKVRKFEAMLKYVGHGEGGPACTRHWERLLKYKREAVVEVVSDASEQDNSECS